MMGGATTCQLLREAHRALARTLLHRMAPHGVGLGQWPFLQALWREDGLTQRELSQRVGMMEPTTVTAINGLERAGLVQRRRNSLDRRKVNIHLTERGSRLREVILPVADEAVRSALRGLSPGEIDALTAALQRVVTNLQANSASFADVDIDV